VSDPRVSVVVPSHGRPIRLRWLLNALEDQTLPREDWEIVVAHDSGDDTEALLATHPLATDGTLRHLRFAPGTGPAAKRNAGWRAARAPLVVFTDDDCRPPEEWLEQALVAGTEHPHAIVQGTTRPDPDEADLLRRAPHARTQHIDPPTPWGQTCNIAYPRELLERLGGFDESFVEAAGEDTDLAQRALASGAEWVAATDVVTYHAVEALPLPVRLRGVWRWRYQAALVKRHPVLREPMPLGIFWKRSHALFALALVGAPLARRHPLVALALAVPWAREALPSYGDSPRGRLRAVSELPGRAALDAVEMTAVARGAVAERTLLL
jgi:glycosyltransferase involved in cell wall biosynthesis